jgi:hypothetical protein
VGLKSYGFLNKGSKETGPQDSLVVQEGGRESDVISDLIGEVPWIPNGEVVDARSQAELVRRCEGGDLSPFPPQKREGLDVGILRSGACLATLKVASQDKEVVM